MKKFNPNTNEQATGHLRPEELRRYQAGELSNAQMHRVEKHLLNCDLCSDALEGLSQFSPEANEAAVAELKTRIETKQKYSGAAVFWRVAAVILLFLISGSIYLLVDKVESDVTPIATLKTEPEQEPPAPIKNGNTDSAPEAIINDSAEAKPTPGERSSRIPEVPSAVEEEAITVAKQPEPEVIEVPDTEEVEQSVSVAPPPPVNSPARQERFQSADSDVEELAIAGSLADKVEVEDPSPDASLDIANSLQGTTAGVDVKKKSEAASTHIKLRGISSIATNTSPGRVIKGKVISSVDGEPLPGVAVQWEGSAYGVTTNVEGEYEITLPTTKNTSLTYNFYGYNSLNLAVNDTTTILMARLEEDTETLDEVVVTAYGIEREQQSLGYSVQAADAGEFQIPQPVNGKKAYAQYLEESLKYTPEAQKAKVEGTVKLKLTIGPGGSIDDIEVKKSLGYGLDEEGIRLVKEGPAWQPARQNGVPVEHSVVVKVRFKLSE